MELWDLYDEERQPLNKTHCRGEEMKTGEYHIVVEVWTVNDDKEVLLTLRHPDKKEFANLWENTGGSTIAGETSKAGAVRELYEETGIVALENELFYLGTNKGKTAFVDVYMLRKNKDISELKMQEGETVDAKWVNLEKFDEMINSGEIALPVIERLIPYREEFEKYLFNQTINY